MVPKTASVTTITANAMNTNRSRGYTTSSGQVPSGGSASAAASVTTPRMPAQAITTGTWIGGGGSRRRILGTSRGR